MKIKNICIIAKEYPSTNRVIYTFVEELVNEFTNYDINCYVISPQSVSSILFKKIPKSELHYKRRNIYKRYVDVYRPYYLSMSNSNKMLNYFSLYSFTKATQKIFKNLSKSVRFDLIYAHFIFPSAIAANSIGKKYDIPVFFAYGENASHNTSSFLGVKSTRKKLKGVSGVIAVSNYNKERLLSNHIVDESLIKVFPNSVNDKIFRKVSKQEVRNRLGFSLKDFIVIFVGRFVNTKGIHNLDLALSNISNDNIKAIFIGDGPLKPKYNNILFKGIIPHDKIADYLSASDLFILPTSDEGCSNAIVEALACGLPVISSNKPFNDEILDSNCSIRVNEENVKEIENSILKLYNDSKYREDLSRGALKKAANFKLSSRAEEILNFIEEKV